MQPQQDMSNKPTSCFISSVAPLRQLFRDKCPFTAGTSTVSKSSSWVLGAHRLPKTNHSYLAPTTTVRCCTERPAWKTGPVDVDFARDEQLEILEETINEALEGQQYSKAASLQEKLLRLQSGASVAVLSANLKFYHALNTKSVVDMAGCWYQSPLSTCKFPGGPLVRGYIDIVNSYGYLFTYALPKMEIRNCHINMRGSVGYVTCDQVCMDENGEKVVTCATNIYIKHNSQWYLHHHSSMIVNSE